MRTPIFINIEQKLNSFLKAFHKRERFSVKNEYINLLNPRLSRPVRNV